jgi:hypothetical protein
MRGAAFKGGAALVAMNYECNIRSSHFGAATVNISGEDAWPNG